jgi:RecB family endonuclease NucS
LDYSLLNGWTIEWLGNEVSCGVGMQRIDVMLSLVNGNIKIVLPIELKSVEASTENVIQIQRYVDWLEQYYIPNRISDIQPVLISKKISNKTSINYKNIIESFKQFNKKNNRCMPIKYIEYELEDNNLIFQEIIY